MIIKSKRGSKLRLGKEKLTEISGYEYNPYYFHFSEVNFDKVNFGEGPPLSTVTIRMAKTVLPGGLRTINSIIDFDNRKIGCQSFSKVNFNKIIHAIKAYQKGKKK